MKIVIGSDKSGFALKEHIKEYLAARGAEVVEVGTVDVESPVPFYRVAPEASKLVADGTADRGILICGTGMGMSQVANKYRGIRAACVESTYCARMSRAINDSNVLCMGGWVIAPELAVDIVNTFLDTEHTEGLEPWRQTFLKGALEEFKRLESSIYG